MIAETFHFLRPAWLLAAIPLAVLIPLALRARRTDSAWTKICDPVLLRRLLVSREDAGRRFSHWPLAAFSGAWLATVVALAGPTWQRIPRPTYREPEQTMFDLSLAPSMNAKDVSPSRMARARFKLLDALTASRGGEVGLVVYAEEPFAVTPLTDDPGVVASMVPVLEPRIMPGHADRLDRAIDEAARLLDAGGATSGRIVVLTDRAGDEPALAEQAASRAAAAGHTVSVLGVGTSDGAPIPAAHGFVTGPDGKAILAKLDPDALGAVASAGDGAYSNLTAGDQDVERVLSVGRASHGLAAAERTGVDADVWRDMGAWLVWIPLLLAPLAFRRGWVAAAILSVLVLGPSRAQASSIDGWLARPDQQGAEAFAEGDPARAAELFQNQAWRSAALYRSGDYEAAAQALADLPDPDSQYNLGNALAKSGQLEQAIAAYDRALEQDPADEDATFNRDLVRKLLEQQKQQQQQQASQGEQGQQNDQAQQQGEQQGQGQNQQQGEGQGQDQRNAAKESDQGDAQDQGGDQARSADGQQGDSADRASTQRAAATGTDATAQATDRGGDRTRQTKQAAASPSDSDQSPEDAAKDAAKDAAAAAAELAQAGQKPESADAQATPPSQKATAAEQANAGYGQFDDSTERSQQAGAVEDDGRISPEEQSIQQALARIPDDPAGLLRAKLERRYMEDRYGRRGTGGQR